MIYMRRKKLKKTRNKINSAAIHNCQSKIKFFSEKEAIKASEMQNLSNLSLNITVYKCDICSKWHLTKQQS